MSQQMLKFVSIGTRMPKKRPAARRRRDFEEIYHGFAPDWRRQNRPADALNVAFRFARCIVRSATIFPDWLQLTAEGRLEEAYELCFSDQQSAGDLRPDLSPRSAVRRETV